MTLVSWRGAQLSAMPSNHESNSGTKWAHLTMLNVFWLARARWGKAKNGPTAAVNAARFRKSRREGVLVFTLDILLRHRPLARRSTSPRTIFCRLYKAALN